MVAGSLGELSVSDGLGEEDMAIVGKLQHGVVARVAGGDWDGDGRRIAAGSGLEDFEDCSAPNRSGDGGAGVIDVGPGSVGG